MTPKLNGSLENSYPSTDEANMTTPIKKSPQRYQKYTNHENLGQNINETIDLEFFKKN